MFKRALTTHECANQLLQLVTGLQQDVTGTAMEIGWRAADPSRYPQHVCRGLVRLLWSHGEVSCESARWLAKQIGYRLPLDWGLSGIREKQSKISYHLWYETVYERYEIIPSFCENTLPFCIVYAPTRTWGREVGGILGCLRG